MATFRVVWEFKVEADTASDAAMIAAADLDALYSAPLVYTDDYRTVVQVNLNATPTSETTITGKVAIPPPGPLPADTNADQPW